MKKYILLLLIVLSLGSCKYQTANGAWRPKHLGFHIRPDLKSLDDLDSIPFEINMIFHEYDDEAEDTTRIIFIFSKDGRFVMTYERNVTDHSDTIRIDQSPWIMGPRWGFYKIEGDDIRVEYWVNGSGTNYFNFRAVLIKNRTLFIGDQYYFGSREYERVSWYSPPMEPIKNVIYMGKLIEVNKGLPKE